MIKKIIMTMVVLFSMVSLAIADAPAFSDDYVTFENGDVIKVDLCNVPSYGVWDVGLYTFTTDDTGDIKISIVDLFCDDGTEGGTITLTFNDGWVSNGRGPNTEENFNNLEMIGNNLGIVFCYGPDANSVDWYSHPYLNGGVDYFEIFEDDTTPGGFTFASWAGTNGYPVGIIGMSSVPIPGAVWLLGSGLIGMVAVRKRS